MLYVVLGHRVANRDAGSGAMSGIDQLGAAMLVAAVAITPLGLGEPWIQKPARAGQEVTGAWFCHNVDAHTRPV